MKIIILSKVDYTTTYLKGFSFVKHTYTTTSHKAEAIKVRDEVAAKLLYFFRKGTEYKHAKEVIV